MAVDLSRMNHDQLAALIERAQARQAELAKEKASKLRQKIRALVESEGLDFADVMGASRGRKSARKAKASTTRAKKKTRKVPPKYRNPADSSQVWSGRGLQPRWFAAALKSGKKEKDLLIR